MTTTELPGVGWLNIDQLIDPDMSDMIGQLADEFETDAYEMEEKITKARVALRHIQKLYQDAGEQVQAAVPDAYLRHFSDGIHEIVMAVSGGDRLWNAMARLSEALDPESMDKGAFDAVATQVVTGSSVIVCTPSEEAPI